MTTKLQRDIAACLRLTPDMADEVALYLIARAAEAREVVIGG